MPYDTVPATDDECSCEGDPERPQSEDVQTVEVENLNWVTSELKIYPGDVVPEPSNSSGYFLTGEVIEDDPRQISIGGWDATEYANKNSDLGDCCLWVPDDAIEAHDLEPYVVDEWDGGRR